MAVSLVDFADHRCPVDLAIGTDRVTRRRIADRWKGLAEIFSVTSCAAGHIVVPFLVRVETRMLRVILGRHCGRFPFKLKYLRNCSAGFPW